MDPPTHDDLHSRRREARQCAQEIISAHAQKAFQLCATLMDEYVEANDQLLPVTFGFIDQFVFLELRADDHDRDACELFRFAVTLLGNLVAAVAGDDHDHEDALVRDLATATYSEDVDQGTRSALMAAQASLAIHMVVRRGSPPWGVQRNLRLNDMRSVVVALGHLIHAFLERARVEVGDALLMKVLVPAIHEVVSDLARTGGLDVNGYLTAAWVSLAKSDTQS